MPVCVVFVIAEGKPSMEIPVPSTVPHESVENSLGKSFFILLLLIGRFQSMGCRRVSQMLIKYGSFPELQTYTVAHIFPPLWTLYMCSACAHWQGNRVLWFPQCSLESAEVPFLACVSGQVSTSCLVSLIFVIIPLLNCRCKNPRRKGLSFN